ncbi:uncharacterized protein ACB058_019436 [Synchiropus picturatus]
MAYSTGTIAQGCFGKIYKEKYGDTWAAIKRVPQHMISRKDLERECNVYKKSAHPNIVKLLGNVNLVDGKWVIPLEFVFGEDLETTIFKASNSKITLSPATRGIIIRGMCEGLLHLHSRDIVHQDLKPDNIMVEHNTHRAVIIDLGLAKFYKYGLSSAVDMGNEAYSAPEVLQRGSQRDQRSDVWAMGKIIAELCVRMRLFTPSVNPSKIRQIMGNQPYCHSVCRMVDPNPSLRASIGGVISEIRAAATPQPDQLKPPLENARNRSPSPGEAARNRDPSPHRRAHVDRSPSPFNREPIHRSPSPSPFNREQFHPSPSPFHKEPIHPSPSPFHKDPIHRRSPSPFHKDPIHHRSPSPFHKEPIHPSPSPFHKDPIHRSPSPFNKDPKDPPLRQTQSDKQVPAGNKIQDLVHVAQKDMTSDMLKMQMYQAATKDLPCKLPPTGRVMVQRFEEINGEYETWQQKEVVTRDGKIVKYDDIKFNSK